MRNVLEYKTPSVSPENENNVLTITGAVPLTTACFEFQDEGDVNVFTACFPQSREYSAGRREAGGRQEGGREAGRRQGGGHQDRSLHTSSPPSSCHGVSTRFTGPRKTLYSREIVKFVSVLTGLGSNYKSFIFKT